MRSTRDRDRRVVITGMGVISPLGNDVETLWRNLVAGKSAAAPFTRFDASEFKVRIACEVNDFDPTDWMDRKEARRLDRFVQFGLAATHQAVDQACLRIDENNAERIGVIVGAAYSGMETIHQGYADLNTKGPTRVNPLTTPMLLASMAASQVNIVFGAKGWGFGITSACATGNIALGEAFEVIRRGDADVIIAGATDAPLTPFLVAAAHRTGALSQRNDDPQRASRPFDASRDGFVCGEGAGIVIMESIEHARNRGAQPLAEFIGYGASADAYHVSAPAEDGAGAILAMRRALDRAGIRPEDVDYINAHGTSTISNDAVETRAIKKVFGDQAYSLPISSTKSMIGHLQGAAGTVEAIACVKTLQEGIIHPTINYEYPDPECDLDYVPNQARQVPVRIALSNAFGMGGHNATIVLRTYEP